MDIKLLKNYGIAMIQMCVIDDKVANNTTAVRLIRTAVQKNTPRCVMLPEYFNTPFGRRDLFERSAECIPTGETCTLIAKLAAELRIYIICGSIPERDARDVKKLFNTMVVFGPTGELLTKHRQMHHIRQTHTTKTAVDDLLKLTTTTTTDIITKDDCDMWMRRDGADWITRGDQIGMFDMDGIKVGCCVGTDLWHGCVATCCRERGCDLLVCAVSMPERIGTLCVEKLLCTRAMETQCIVIGLTVGGVEERGRTAMTTPVEGKSCGRTMCVDACGRVVCVAGKGEEIVCHRCDFVGLKELRCVLPVFECRRTDVCQTTFKC